MNKNNLEFRYAQEAVVLDDKVLSGKAISFETSSNDLGFWETIHRGAISQELIDNSDIVFCYNHDVNQVLARSNKNRGSLKVELREDGVYFSFIIPDTTLGHDVYELVKRGDICHCSFAFTISDEPGSLTWTKRDGELFREINKIDGLYDLSCVTHEAYSDTSINARSIEMRDEAEKLLDDNMDKEKELTSEEETKVEEVETKSSEETEEVKEETTNSKEDDVETKSSEDEEEVKDEETTDSKEEDIESKSDEDPSEDEEKEEKEIRSSKINILKNKNKDNHKFMKKKFSLISAINEVRSGKGLSEMNAQVNEQAIAEMRASGLNNFGDINLPCEQRAIPIVSVGAEGEDLVETEIYDVLGALRAKLVFNQAGAHFLNGLQGNVQIPVFSGNNVAWAEENAAATNGEGTFSNVKLSPKRLTAYVDISNSLLIQANSDIESLIYNDLIAAVADKLEATILGSAAGSATQPRGLMNADYIANYDAPIDGFHKVCELEAVVERNNFFGEMKYIINPSAKAVLRSMVKGENAGAGFVMQGNEIDGTPVLTTGNANGIIYGDWSQLYIGQWANISITVDKISQAINDVTRLVVNCYFDAVVARPEGLVKGSLN